MAEGTYEQVINELDRLGIKYGMVDHPAAETTEEADKYIEGHEGVRTKTMFLKGKKHHFYLVIMDDKKPMNFKEFEELTGAKRVSMARPDDLKEQLGSHAGVVSPFCLMNNEEHNVQVYFDKDMLAESPVLTFHPNVNTHTIFIKTPDLLNFIKEQGYEPETIDL
ncbi:prolyl-tRNA synthetase associated domain-containing protein [Limosilactobacillus sp. RRLNB_1_1]|uniref:Prolyl-tRNA synthetase associated domain-containing protein n=1 Tax=Limosilactobacillus albertensis TaxID=2759752 RepID=A0A7W3Y8R4_9LACO|nr:prolyl-tRNA synthetase associated domain-containing protein [Limosilactobacillus albertensis]MBB1069926.1 prolyl-tRNA synthetase associated domain-containing protein [Limosilactobacillus albertensis]MCD7117163.1 prolyl-tRNA synthetase associated domain-containing protein [Limosilactobacillus albertensis]MCD7128767.1 prolyl-tRNA synthetase associated domain-containing protein [Limosilactobacillus albertensis]